MCHPGVLGFFVDEVNIEEFKDKNVLEVGSKYVNGSIRPIVEKFLSPRKYIGIDIEPGQYVDVVVNAENIVNHFGENVFDIVISTELLEHVQNWRLVVNNIKQVLKSNGFLYITTRSKGFPYHGYPYDFWRYEINDMQDIFSDFQIIVLRKDHEAPGIFLKAQKPDNCQLNNLQGLSLYSMVLGKRVNYIPDINDMPLSRKLLLKTGERARRIKMQLRDIIIPK